MKRIKLISVFVSVLFAGSLMGQSRFSTHVDFRYLSGLQEHTFFGKVYDDVWSDGNLSGSSLRITEYYRLNPQWKIGLGIGADKSALPSIESLPIYAAASYHPLGEKYRPYLYTMCGYAIPTKISNAGANIDVGVGYNFMFATHFGLSAKVGYNFRNAIVPVYFMEGNKRRFESNGVSNRHSLVFSFGFVF